MAGSAKRERQLARERYERQQQRRSRAAEKRRQTQQVGAVVLAVVLVIGGVIGLATLLGDDATTNAADRPGKSASASPAATPTGSPSPTGTAAGGRCTYTKSAEKASKDVSIPTYDVKKAASYRKPFTATLATNRGDIVIRMTADKAPCATHSFRHLASSKFYDGTSCHRLTTENIYVLQCGDPTGAGSGGPGYGFGVENAPADGNYPAGTVAMARTADPNSNGSQFFLVYKGSSLPDKTGYTVFGRLVTGLDIVAKVAAAGTTNTAQPGDGPPKQKVTIRSVTLGKAAS